MVYNTLIKEDRPLHITTIIKKVKSAFKVELDRETIVSAITRKVKRNDRFLRTDRKSFATSRCKKD